MNRLDRLSDLQTMDIRIEENRRARQEAEARLANDAARVSAQNDLEAANRAANQWRARLRALELEADSIGERIKGVDARLYGGRINNPKELSGLEQDELMLKRRKSEVEDRMLEAMAQLETAEAQVASRRAALDKITIARAAAHAHDHAQLEELGAEADKLKVAREQLRAQIAPADLQVYDDLFRTKKNRAVAHLKNTSCSACGFAVPSGLASRAKLGELVFCANCGRILVS
jgi:uncharacterized protein